MEVQRLNKKQIKKKIKELYPYFQILQVLGLSTFGIGFVAMIFWNQYVGLSVNMLGIIFLMLGNHLGTMIKIDQLKYEIMEM